MADDPLTKFRNSFEAKGPTASAKPPSSPEHEALDPYEAFENKVRPVALEIRCHRDGLSYSIPYAHLGAIIFDFRTGAELVFTGCGFAFTVRGRDLREVARAIRLHVCELIEDYSPHAAIRPEGVDAHKPFIESITAEPLRGTPPLPGE